MTMMLEVKVVPRAKRNEVSERDGQIVVRVTAPADDGKANAAVLRLLAQYLAVPVSRLTIQRGARSRRKVIART
ncbi:MAG: DUF167 domain-containing protein [Candidatus Kerfeldbacteria bacterium]|nr:DUF167 domain-containing protein [Candidatus Kerfeldbacteria bacterium]